MNQTAKFLFDRVASLIALLVLLPLFLAVAAGILLTSPGPVFFRQKRVGRHGRLFTLIKFRTMRVNKDKNTITAANDSRITHFGTFLRKWKIDELPELINVLTGQMSFVGPRPDVPGYADRLEGSDRRILELRPGITGPASLKYLNEEDILAHVPDPAGYNDRVIFPDKVRINLLYLERQSFTGDIRIMIQTLLRKPCNEYEDLAASPPHERAGVEIRRSGV